MGDSTLVPLIESAFSSTGGKKSRSMPARPFCARSKRACSTKRCDGTGSAFPSTLCFIGPTQEYEALKSQLVISNEGRVGRRYRPYAFTGQGIARPSSVLRSTRAIEVHIAILRAFVRLRQILATHEDLARQLDELRGRQEEHGQQIQTIQDLIEAPAEDPKKRFGFPVSEAVAPVGE
jgi:hypothetical protein